MVLSARGKYWYTPKFNGNRDAPGEERVTVEIIRPKAEERPELYSMDIERDIGLVDPEKKPARDPVTLKSRFRTSRILRNHIGIIKNLSVEEDGKSRTVSSGADLAESTAFGLGSLVQELTAEVFSDRLSADEKKSLPPASNSSTKDGPENDGTRNTTTSGKSSASGSSGGERSAGI
jgi:hypothetical protein